MEKFALSKSGLRPGEWTIPANLVESTNVHGNKKTEFPSGYKNGSFSGNIVTYIS